MAKRTSQQNKALHKGFELVAKTLNDAGLDMRAVLKPEIDIPWTKDSVKKYLYKSILALMYDKEHTAEMDKLEEPSQVWETMMRFLMEKHHIDYIPFPHDPEKDKETIGGAKVDSNRYKDEHEEEYKGPPTI